MDRIRICDLLVRCVLGINEDERRERQDVVINLTIHADLQQAGKSDNMKDTVDLSPNAQRNRRFQDLIGFLWM